MLSGKQGFEYGVHSFGEVSRLRLAPLYLGFFALRRLAASFPIFFGFARGCDQDSRFAHQDFLEPTAFCMPDQMHLCPRFLGGGGVFVKLLRQASVAQDSPPSFLLPASVLSQDDELLFESPLPRNKARAMLQYFMCQHFQQANTAPMYEYIQSLTVHSCKTTMLAFAKRLFLPEEWRLEAGHRRDQKRSSLLTYGRDDTSLALALQCSVHTAISHGWTPQIPRERGGLISWPDQIQFNKCPCDFPFTIIPAHCTGRHVDECSPRPAAEGRDSSPSSSSSSSGSSSVESEGVAEGVEVVVDAALLVVNSKSQVVHACGSRSPCTAACGASNSEEGLQIVNCWTDSRRPCRRKPCRRIFDSMGR